MGHMFMTDLGSAIPTHHVMKQRSGIANCEWKRLAYITQEDMCDVILGYRAHAVKREQAMKQKRKYQTLKKLTKYVMRHYPSSDE